MPRRKKNGAQKELKCSLNTRSKREINANKIADWMRINYDTYTRAERIKYDGRG